MKIHINLNNTDWNNTISQLEQYRHNLISKTNEVAKRLAEYGLMVAQVKLSNAGIGNFPGDRIYIEERENNTFAVCAESEEILFLEFGTGITYSGNRHPQSDEFGYGAGTYPSEKQNWNNPNGWWYYDEYAGRYVHTIGNPPLMMMYDTSKEMRNRIENIVKEVFGNHD